MLDRLNAYSPCLHAPEQWAVATVISVSGSVPRPVGTSMAVRSDSTTIGSISGGCVESAIVDAALSCIADGRSAICDFGYGDDDGMSLGLMCGGDIRVLIDPVIKVADQLRALLPTAEHGDSADEHSGSTTEAAAPTADTGALIRELPASTALSNGALVETPAETAETDLTPLPALAVTALTGEILPPAYAAQLGRAARTVEELIHSGGCGIAEVRDESVVECPIIRRVFVESRRPRARALIYGANDFSSAIAQAAAALGLHVTVCDARPVFATRARHPGAHEVIVARPGDHFAEEINAGRIDSRTAVIMLTHDPRFDLPVLDRALRMDLVYVGAMGSRTTHERRAQELINGGLPPENFARLHSPIGLDIGARTPPEVAVAVLAEYIACTRRPGQTSSIPQLRDTSGPVHADRSAVAPPHRGGPIGPEIHHENAVPVGHAPVRAQDGKAVTSWT